MWVRTGMKLRNIRFNTLISVLGSRIFVGSIFRQAKFERDCKIFRCREIRFLENVIFARRLLVLT